MPATGASPAPPPPPRSKVKRKAPKPPVQEPLADDPYGQGIPGANPYGFTSYDPDQAAPYEDAFDEQPVGGLGRGVVRSTAHGFAAVNAARQAVENEAGALDEQPEDEDVEVEPPVEEAPQKPHILESEPETVIGETLQIEGTLRFERLLRLDGKFEGDLVSTGDLIVGPRGELVGDVRDMADLVVFGKVIGNINVDHLELCGAASIYGDVTGKTLLMDPTVVLVGTLNVNPFAPNLMDRHGDEVPPEGAGVVPTSPPTSPVTPAEAPAAAPATPPASARSEPEATPAVEPAPSPVKAPAEPAKSPEKPAEPAPEPDPVPSPVKSPAKEPAPEPTEAPPASPAKAPEPVAEPAKAPEPEPAAAAEPAKSPEKPAPAEQVGGAPPAADTSDAPAEAAKSPAKPAEPAAEPAAEPVAAGGGGGVSVPENATGALDGGESRPPSAGEAAVSEAPAAAPAA